MTAPDASEEQTVLLVDDNVELLELLTNSLRYIGGFRVLSALDGAAGLELAMNERPDCIVIDVMMPGIDGFQLAHALRGDPESAGIPQVMLTALAQEENRMAGLLSGADRYLVKPVRIPDLIEAIQAAIAMSHAERDRALRRLAEEGEA
jgi:two-component system OmpR family response regulator